MLFILILQRWTCLLRTEARVAARGCRNEPAGKRETQKRPSLRQQQRLKSGTHPEVKRPSFQQKDLETFSKSPSRTKTNQ